MSHSDVGQYSYGSAPGITTPNAGGPNSRPHTLLSITGQAGKLTNPVYAYDAHGNITQVTSSNGAARTHTWTSFDNPQSLALKAANGDSAAVTFLYGSDHQRMREVSSQTKASVTTQKTLSVLHPDNAGALYFERETINSGPNAGAVENRHYLTAEKGAFLLITSSGSLQANPAATTLANAQQRYWHKDHLGSIVASTLLTATSTVGMVIERMAYEPFGKRRYTTGQADPAGTIDATSTTRGFTGHEHLDSLDFIHMNARVYDPDIGRFLSPDPTVPDAHNPQAFNRYAYTTNNPLNLVDPDGFEPVGADGQRGSGDEAGYRGAAAQSGPHTDSSRTTEPSNAIGLEPSKKDAAPMPGFAGNVPPADKPQTGFLAALDWYDKNIANPMMAVPVAGAVLKAPSALAQDLRAAAQVEKVVEKANVVAAAAKTIGNISGTPRAITAADLGLKGKVSQLDGTISVVDGKLTVNIDMVAGRFTNQRQDVTSALNNLAVSLSAKSIEVNATIANSALGRALSMDGWAASKSQVAPYADTFTKAVK